LVVKLFLRQGEFVKAERGRVLSQSILFDGQAVSTAARQPSIRIQKNILARLERDLLNWLCLHMPRAARRIAHGTGVVGAGIVFVGYVASRFDLAFLWLATFGLVVHWLATRLTEPRRYAVEDRAMVFLDHSVDAVCNLMIMVGSGFSFRPFGRRPFALLGYFMLCMYGSCIITSQETFNCRSLRSADGASHCLIGINCWMYCEGARKHKGPDRGAPSLL